MKLPLLFIQSKKPYRPRPQQPLAPAQVVPIQAMILDNTHNTHSHNTHSHITTITALSRYRLMNLIGSAIDLNNGIKKSEENNSSKKCDDLINSYSYIFGEDLVNYIDPVILMILSIHNYNKIKHRILPGNYFKILWIVIIITLKTVSATDYYVCTKDISEAYDDMTYSYYLKNEIIILRILDWNLSIKQDDYETLLKISNGII
jgi:hypothetical protein